MTGIYLIYARDANGESLDLAVEAENAAQAETLWRDWVENDFGGEPDENDFAIYSLPTLKGFPHTLAWGLEAICMKDTRS